MQQQSDAVGSRDETSNPGETFNPAEVKGGAPFFYINGGRSVAGCVGKVCSHNDGCTHVIHDGLGSPVCVINGDAPKLVLGDTVYVSAAGQGTVFAFHPQS